MCVVSPFDICQLSGKYFLFTVKKLLKSLVGFGNVCTFASAFGQKTRSGGIKRAIFERFT